LAFPFEALELLTNNLTRIAMIAHIGIIAPKGENIIGCRLSIRSTIKSEIKAWRVNLNIFLN